MESTDREIVYIGGERGARGDFPVAVIHTQRYKDGELHASVGDNLVVDPVFNSAIYGNLFGRLMTLVEATTDAYKLKAVKDLFSKELQTWSNDVYQSAREIASGGDSSTNLYTRRSNKE